MKFYLAKTLEKIKYYGPIPNLSCEPDKVEEYSFDEEENEWLLDNLVDMINFQCGTLLDDGDVDFFNVEQCKALINLIEDLNDDLIPVKYRRTINILKDYATRAVSYNTGIAIDL